MSRLDAVVRVLKATGKALHYNIITRQALQQGIIRFTGSQGTAGESMKAFLNKTIRENKTAAIVNMGKGVYGLKVARLFIFTHARTCARVRTHTLITRIFILHTCKQVNHLLPLASRLRPSRPLL